ncbi:hypothetical protein LWI28_010233 [Acer negundo]|uniref:DUF4283 domain-containing protein n=1 Tax=Acer negundo TaxID=4023 RepID=A0AAD5NHJ1_ACENE|nr:hypothetical protein LWI28_010233 [Acer negundo]
MDKWFSVAMAKARPVWLNFPRVPLCFRNLEFFMKMGRSIGEPLIIDEETILRHRLDMGRMLVLIQHGKPCPKRVKVYDGRRNFEITVEEERSPVTLGWIEDLLDLTKVTKKVFDGSEARRGS